VLIGYEELLYCYVLTQCQLCFLLVLAVLSIHTHGVILRKPNFMLFRSLNNLFCALCSKTCLNLVISRIKLLRNRRELQLINMRKEMVQYLQTGQESIARIRVSWSYSCFVGIALSLFYSWKKTKLLASHMNIVWITSWTNFVFNLHPISPTISIGQIYPLISFVFFGSSRTCWVFVQILSSVENIITYVRKIHYRYFVTIIYSSVHLITN
jgi:hypothetical protein